MICTKCGRAIADNSRFCTFCGENVEPKSANEPEAPREPEVPKEPAFPTEPNAPTDVTSPEASTASETSTPPTASAAPTGAPQGFPPPGVAPTGAYQPAPQGFPPPGSPQGAPQGFPPPGTPQGAYQNAPQDTYQGAPAYPATPPAPKKKTGIIIAVIVAVLLLCGAVTVGGLLLISSLVDQNLLDSLESSESPNLERHSIDNGNNSDNYGSNSDDNRGINRATGDDVLLDTDELTVILDLASGELDEDFGWYQVWCTVENKTDTKLSLYFDYDTSIDGVDSDDFNIVLFPDNEDAMFAPHTTTEGVIAIFTLPPDGAITNLEGTLVVFQFDTFETVGEYPVSIPKL